MEPEWLIRDEALWRWSIDKGGYNRIGALENLVPYEEPPAGGDETAWKVEDGALWMWDWVPRPTEPGWVCIGPLSELVRREPALELPACTVEQAEAAMYELIAGRGMPAISVLFPEVSRAGRLGEWGGASAADFPSFRRALALALRAFSDRLLEVAGS